MNTVTRTENLNIQRDTKDIHAGNSNKKSCQRERSLKNTNLSTL